MLKKIPTPQAELGMFLQSMEGSWLSHPFWKTKFLLADPADLAALKKSGVPYIWIDVAKGRDLLSGGAAPAAAAPLSAATPAEPAQAAGSVSRDEAALVVDDIASSVWRNPSTLISLARLKTKDDYTYMHSVAVCAMMIALARQLGMTEAEQRLAGEAGLLHDVGKMLMPLEVLNKPGALTDDEFAVMKSHPERGHAALLASGAFSDGVLDVVLHHHEKLDGSGYPRKLAGDQISLLARMGAVCDVYDAITSNRPYKQAWDPAASLARMAQWKGYFDPRIFQAFVVSLGIYPVGTLVRLHSGRLAVVVDQNPGKLTAPKIKVFFSTKSNMPIDVKEIDLASDGSERIVGRGDPAQWGFTHLNELWSRPA